MLDDVELSHSVASRNTLGKIIGDLGQRISKATDIIFRFRGVEFGRLDAILENGIDVIPATSAIYTSYDPCKSMEYGWDHFDKKMILLMYDASAIERTFKHVAIDTPEEEINKLMETYPTRQFMTDDTIWLSRLAMEDKRRAKSYEVEYGGWIPTNPFAALWGIIYIGNFSEENLNSMEAKLKK
jgi:hypothetical protein